MIRSLVISIALALIAGSVAAGEMAFPIPAASPNGIIAAADGAIWFTAYPNIIGRRKPDGSILTSAITQPQMEFNRNRAMQPLPDGSLLIACGGGIAIIDASLHVVSFAEGEEPLRFIPARDGTYWFVSRNQLGQVNASGVVLQAHELPFNVRGAVGLSDGTLFVGADDGIYRGSVAGIFQLIAECQSCAFDWMEAMSDGTIAFEGGRLLHDGSIVLRRYYAHDAVLGPDGHLWVAGWFNLLRIVSNDGSVRELPVEQPGKDIVAITATDDALWYTVPGELRRITPDVQRDLLFRDGDILTRETDENHSIDGTHPVLAHHRRGGAPFVRRLLWSPGSLEPFSMQGNVFATSASRVLASWSGALVARTLNGMGDLTGTVALGAPVAVTSMFAVDRNDTMYAVRLVGSDYRVLTIDARGAIQRDIAFPIHRGLNIRAVDLAADQCTLFYVAISYSGVPARMIGRIDVCRGTSLPDFRGDIAEAPRDVRVTREGDVIVAYPSKIARYDRFGVELQALHAVPNAEEFFSIALDPDSRFVWIGTWSDLRRVEWATGATVESQTVYGPPGSISIVGEPRAARAPLSRRRSAAH